MVEDMTASELNERIRFFSSEYHSLRAESVLESNPTTRYRIEQNMKEALIHKEIAEKLLENIPEYSSGSVNTKQSYRVNAVPHSANNPPNKKPQDSTKDKKHLDLLQSPIGYTGITMIAGVLVLFIAYLIRKHLGIPL